jgi:hypothetical protein
MSERALLNEIAELDQMQLGLDSTKQFATPADEKDKHQSPGFPTSVGLHRFQQG